MTECPHRFEDRDGVPCPCYECLRAECERLTEIVERIPPTAATLMACHDVIRDLLALRQGRPSAFVSSERLEQLADECRAAAEKARHLCT